MKREHIQPDETYVTDDLRVVRIEGGAVTVAPHDGPSDTEVEITGAAPGFSLRDGEWVYDPQMGRRFYRGERGYREYQANLNVRAWQVGKVESTHVSPSEPKKIVVSPRNLQATLTTHLEQEKKRVREAKAHEALASSIRAMLTSRHITVLHIDPERRRVTCDLTDLLRALDLEV